MEASVTIRHTGPTGPSKMHSHMVGGYYSWLARWGGPRGWTSWILSWPLRSRIRIAPVSATGNDINRDHDEAERQFVRNVKDGELRAVEAMSVIMDVDMPEALRLMEKWG